MGLAYHLRLLKYEIRYFFLTTSNFVHKLHLHLIGSGFVAAHFRGFFLETRVKCPLLVEETA